MAARKFDDTLSTSNTKEVEILHGNILSDDGALKYDFMTSLENISVAKIVSNLLMNQNTQQKIVTLFQSCVGKPSLKELNEWKQIDDYVVTLISELQLPESIAKKLINIVPLLGSSIFQWIVRYEYIFYNSEYHAADLISNIKWTARGKIDHAETARNLLTIDSLSDDHKYKIACTFCLEDEIGIIAPKVVNQRYLESVHIDIYPMVYFWTGRITGDNTKLYEASYYNSLKREFINQNTSINENIFHLLTTDIDLLNGTFFYVSIRHMWNELSKEEKANNISLILGLNSFELIYSLLSNLNYEQQQKAFKTGNCKIFGDLFNNWLWGEYFLPTALRILDVMDPVHFHCVLDVIIKLKNENYEKKNMHLHDKYKSVFKLLWQLCPKHLKDDFFKYENEYRFRMLIKSLLTVKQDGELIELIFKDLNTEQKKNLWTWVLTARVNTHSGSVGIIGGSVVVINEKHLINKDQ